MPMVSLPDDLVTDVLLRLPARSLARFLCVCRSWNAWITSRSFQDQHHHIAFDTSSLPPKLALILPVAPQPCRLFWQCTDCYRAVGTKPCRGVVLVERCDGTYSVCNPSTGGILHLPSLRARTSPMFNSMGIGYLAQTREYKVVNLNVRLWGSECQVLTVGDGQESWRPPVAGTEDQLPTINRGVFADGDVDPVFADGCLHWMCRTNYTVLDEPHLILSFALADESLRRVPQPLFSTADVVPVDYGHIAHRRPKVIGSITSGSDVMMPSGRALAELDGRLCMVRDVRRRSDVDRLLEIWKLQDYETGSWSMDYSINLTGHAAERLTRPWLALPVCYIGSGAMTRKMLLVTSAHEAHVYDPATNALHRVATVADRGIDDSNPQEVPLLLNKEEKRSEFVRHVIYQESLVKLAGMKHGRDVIKFVKLM